MEMWQLEYFIERCSMTGHSFVLFGWTFVLCLEIVNVCVGTAVFTGVKVLLDSGLWGVGSFLLSCSGGA